MTDDVTDTGRDKMELAQADEGLTPCADRRQVHDGVPGRRRPARHRACRRVPACDGVHPADDPRSSRGCSRRVTRTSRTATSTTTSPRSPSTGSCRATRSTRCARGIGRRWRSTRTNATQPTSRCGRPPGITARSSGTVPWGEGFPGLAHRVLGDVDGPAGRPLRRAHRRQRQQVPASRGRDRAVGGVRRPPGRLDLGARRLPADGRHEDGEVAGERPPGARPRRPRARPARIPPPVLRDALPQRDELLLGRAGRFQRAPDGLPPADAGVGRADGAPAPRPARATRPRRSRAGSARPSPTTSTCRTRWSCWTRRWRPPTSVRSPSGRCWGRGTRCWRSTSIA